MQFEAKKKSLSTALSTIKTLTEAIDIEEGGGSIRIKALKKTVKLASQYAEATVREVEVSSGGEAVVDLDSLLHALSVSGDKFKFSLGDGNSSASIQCGRTKGKVSLRDGAFDDDTLNSGPKPFIHVPGLRSVLSALALKAVDGSADRTLHLDNNKGVVRGESSDGFRAVMIEGVVEGEEAFTSAALSLPQKACDVLAKAVDDSIIGFDDNFLSVVSPGYKALVPLSADPPLEIREQMSSFLEGKQNLGFFVVGVAEMKSALSDAQSMVGKGIQAQLDLIVTPGNKNACFKGDSDSGELETAFILERVKMKGSNPILISMSAPYLQECLSLYKGDTVKFTIYPDSALIDFLENSDVIKSQTTIVPHAEAIEVDLGGDGEEEDKEECEEEDINDDDLDDDDLFDEDED